MKQADNFDKVCSLIILTTLIFSLLSSLDCEFVKVKVASKIAFGPFSIISSDNWYESDFFTKGVGVGLWSFESPVGNQCFSYTYAQSLPGGVTGTISSYKKWFLNDDLTWSLARTCALSSCLMGLAANIFAWKILLIDHISANTEEPSRFIKHRQRRLLMIMLGFVLSATVLESIKFGTFLNTDVCQRSVWLTTTATSSSVTQKPDHNVRVLNLSPSSNRDSISLKNDENDSQRIRILDDGTNRPSSSKDHTRLQKTAASECTFARGAITSIMSILMNLMLLFMLAAKMVILIDIPLNDHRGIDDGGSVSLISHNDTVKWTLGTKSVTKTFRKSRWPRKNQLEYEGSSNGWTIGTSFRTKDDIGTNDDELWTLGSKSNLNHNILTDIPSTPEIIPNKRSVPRRQSFISDATGKVRNSDHYRTGRGINTPISPSREHNTPMEPQGHKSERKFNEHVDRDTPIDDGTIMRVVPNIFVSCDRRNSGEIPNNAPSSSQQDTHEIPKVVYSAGSDNSSESPKNKTKMARRNSNSGSAKPRQRRRGSRQTSPENGKSKASDPPPSDEIYLTRTNRTDNEKIRNPHMDWICLKCKSNNRGSADECWACSIPNVITTDPERRPSGDTNFVSMITNPNFGNSFDN